ncbi:uncharacterized protein EI90DRAFT_2917775 [Cantharellus anzutake]|uniref:uncharacterized protein n=1 Tax=Cantharellus anzutake TaxID=1750568 RepID=UPI001903AFB7|nr:uncharacterized protein EI90DRAFT_2917775 [Cantharellus anzutake]KAF8332805.1 hypothetical protein EI90DRAFT_2917775 [Cantharellus anzutake]
MDISRDIGTYMLQGWILTNDACPKCIYPLMRSPAARSPPETFCVNCDGGPTGSSSSQPIIAQASEEASAHAESASSSSHRSRASTPPTEVSEPPHNAGDDFDPLPPPSEEVLQRRAQSDYASAEIGKLLLRGYAMLADECPNLTCYGVPLVRPPKTPDGGPSANKV